MAKKFKINVKLNDILQPCLLLVSGILLILFRSSVLNIPLYIVGALFIISAIVTFIKSEIGAAIINLVIGVAIILLAWLLIDLTIIILGVVFFAIGIMSLVRLITSKSKDILAYVSPIILMLLGGLLVYGHFQTILDLILLCAGICIIIYAGYKLIYNIFKKKNQ